MFGAVVARERKARGLSQAECARRSSMTPQQWSRIEKQLSNPQVSTVEAVARGIGINAEVLLHLAGTLLTPPDAVSPEAAEFARRYDKATMRLPAEQKRALDTALESMLSFSCVR